MAIWSGEVKDLTALYESVKGQIPDLEKELQKLIKADDENMVLLYSRRALEVIVTDLCECELGRPRKTEPLKGVIDKLNKEEKVPSNIIASMLNLNSLSAFGAHPKEFDPEQVKPVLNNLTTIIRWYLKYKDAKTTEKEKVEGLIDEVKVSGDTTEVTHKPKTKLIVTLSGFVLVIIVMIALFVFDIIGGGKQTEELEKSIAVLLFINDSPDEENQYIINGIWTEVHRNLQEIEDLRVPGRESIEQYRNNLKPIPEIGKDLNVNYIISASGQILSNTLLLSVELREAAKDKRIWEDSYEQEIEGTEDYFGIYRKIATSICDEINAKITPEEQQLIAKIPTASTDALKYYQLAEYEYSKYQLDNDNKEALETAEDLYCTALEYDSAFAQAYIGLARVYRSKYYFEEYFSEDFLDSLLVLVDIALFYDNQLAEVYTIRGDYYQLRGLVAQAEEEYDKALELNPNDWMAYRGKGGVYLQDDLVKSIDNFHMAVSLNHGSELPNLLRNLGYEHINAGFSEKAIYYYQEALKLDGDSVSHLHGLSDAERFLGNYEKANEFSKKGYAIDSNQTSILLQLGQNYMFLAQYEESLKYYKKYIEILETREMLNVSRMGWIGYVYWQNGYKEEAEYYFNEQINYCNRMNELGRRYGRQQLWTYFYLAEIYAFQGEKDIAYENLKIFNQRQRMPIYMVSRMKNIPLFDSIRDEPEFQQIVREVEAKYQAEHERVRLWLEENDLL